MFRFIAILLISLNVNALEFQILSGTANGGGVLHIWGEYNEDDYDAFLEIVELEDIKSVILGDSQGGLIAESFPIGRYIKSNGLDTIISEGVSCSSSCAMVWAAGKNRFILEGGKANFHAPYVPTESVIGLIDTKCDDDPVDTCVEYTQVEIIEGMRWMTREAIEKGVRYMLEVEAPNEWVIEMLGNSPDSFFTVTDLNIKEYE